MPIRAGAVVAACLATGALAACKNNGSPSTLAGNAKPNIAGSVAPPYQDGGSVQITVSALVNLGVRYGPNYEFHEPARVPAGSQGTAECRAQGTAPIRGNAYWDRITINGNNGYVPEVFLKYAGAARPPACTDAPAYPPEGHQGWETEENAAEVLNAAELNGICAAVSTVTPQECGNVKNSTRDALRIAWLVYRYQRSPDQLQQGQEDQRDALRHCVWQGLMTVRSDILKPALAQQVGNLHEIQTALSPSFWADINSSSAKMDLWNNEVARRAARKIGTESGVIDYCTKAAATAHHMSEDQIKALPVTVQHNEVVNGDYLIYSRIDALADPDYAKDVADPNLPLIQ